MLATLDFKCLSEISRRDPWNSSVTRVLSNVLEELITQTTVEHSRYERIREWLTDPRNIYQMGLILSLGIDSSPPLFVAKIPTGEEFEIGRQLNELRDLEICPGLLYTYALFENTCDPLPRNGTYVWMYKSDRQLMMLEHVPGATFNLDLSPREFASAVLQTILALWTINHRFGRIHYDLHSGNVILRALGEEKWIPYQTPVGPRWIRSSILATVIDYADLELVEQPGGAEVTELLSRIHDDVVTAENKDHSTVNAFFLRKILDPLGVRITWSKSKGQWIHEIDEVESSYQQILETALNLFGQHLDLTTLWSVQPQPTEPHLSYEEIVAHRRPVENVKQLCALGEKFSNRPLVEIDQIITDLNRRFEQLRVSYNRESLIVSQLEPILLSRQSELPEYLRAMIAWADDIHRGYSLWRYLNCVSDLPELNQAVITTLEETRSAYLTHLPPFRQIVASYLEEVDKYHQTYREVCESVANDDNFGL